MSADKPFELVVAPEHLPVVAADTALDHALATERAVILCYRGVRVLVEPTAALATVVASLPDRERV